MYKYLVIYNDLIEGKETFAIFKDIIFVTLSPDILTFCQNKMFHIVEIKS